MNEVSEYFGKSCDDLFVVYRKDLDNPRKHCLENWDTVARDPEIGKKFQCDLEYRDKETNECLYAEFTNNGDRRCYLKEPGNPISNQIAEDNKEYNQVIKQNESLKNTQDNGRSGGGGLGSNPDSSEDNFQDNTPSSSQSNVHSSGQESSYQNNNCNQISR